MSNTTPALNWLKQSNTDTLPCSFLTLRDELLAASHPSKVTDVVLEKESTEYSALCFFLNGKKCLFRQAKTTPKKVGQFVTIWKRDTPDSEIAPFDANDDIDFVIVATFDETNNGFFIFDKAMLVKKGVFTRGEREGKRAIRVYAPWTQPTAKQAISTQKWQTQQFVNMNNSVTAVQQINNIFSQNS